MDQRIGSSSKPLEGAGFDPAHVPGLTSPVTAEPKDAVPEGSVPEGKKAEDDDVQDAAVTEAKTVAEAKTEVDAAEPADDDDSDDEPVDGPVFEAADRRARIVADHKGVRLALDDQACEFRWDEIGAVETETARFGKRFTITVHTPDRRWYPIEIEAASRARFAEWETELDAVLDAYFEDGEGADVSEASEEAAETEAAEATEVAEVTDEKPESEKKAGSVKAAEKA